MGMEEYWIYGAWVFLIVKTLLQGTPLYKSL